MSWVRVISCHCHCIQDFQDFQMSEGARQSFQNLRRILLLTSLASHSSISEVVIVTTAKKTPSTTQTSSLPFTSQWPLTCSTMKVRSPPGVLGQPHLMISTCSSSFYVYPMLSCYQTALTCHPTHNTLGNNLPFRISSARPPLLITTSQDLSLKRVTCVLLILLSLLYPKF